MADEFDHLTCPNCGSELVYSEGTHDLGCKIPNPLRGRIKNVKENFRSNLLFMSRRMKKTIEMGTLERAWAKKKGLINLIT